MRNHGIREFVVNYSCEACLGPIPVLWQIYTWNSQNQPEVHSPRMILPIREEFDFAYVPESVKVEIEEALDCLSVGSLNGFAAVCRRAIQAACTDLGAEASTRVKRQIDEMAKLSGLDDEMKDLAIQIMLSGHDGSHPHLPEMNPERAGIMLSLLRDLVHELYTRPGKIKKAAEARRAAIAAKNRSQIKSEDDEAK